MFKTIKGFVNGVVLTVYVNAIIMMAFYVWLINSTKKPERKYDYSTYNKKRGEY